MPKISLASNQIAMSINNPDPYNGNRTWHQYEEEAGTEIVDTINLHNLSNEVQTVRIYAADAFNNKAGSFILKSQNEEQNGIGIWTKIEANQITLEPEKSVEIEFNISIPESASPGEYYGGIIIENDNNDNESCLVNSENCSNIQVKTRTANRIYLTIPGNAIENIELTELNHQLSADQKKLNLQFRIENNGNIAFEPVAQVSIYDGNKNLIALENLNLGRSLPNSIITPENSVNLANQFGFFEANIRVYFIPMHQNSLSGLRSSPSYQDFAINFSILPWNYFYFALFTISLIAGYLIAQQIIILNLRKKSAEYIAKNGDTLEKLAKKHKINWKTLAKINQLKAPYSIHENDKIKIPQKLNKNENK